MGILESKVYPQAMFPKRELFDVDDNNGLYVMSQVEINDDVLRIIFSFISEKDLIFSCRSVCKNWCNIIDNGILKERFNKTIGRSNTSTKLDLPWYLYYWLVNKKPLKSNLLRNSFGEENFKNWKFLSNGGHHWKVETPPQGTIDDTLHSSCFVTSFTLCSKEQIIDLYNEGAKQQFMDEVKPEIIISEWCAGRFDCKANYELEVYLIGESGEIIDSFTTKKKCGGDYGNEWHQITHTFSNYGKGVRYVRFYHSGVDEQFWAGHYGSKMTGGSVSLAIPSL